MSGKLSTKDIKVGGGGTPKTLQPGNEVCTINSVELRPFKFKKDGYEFIINMEGPDLGSSFDGFSIDRNNASLGKHKGQVGTVKASQWAFADSTTKTGILIYRDQEILKFMKNLCVALDKVSWLSAQDDKHDTIESLINAFNKEAPFKDIKLNCCLAGKEYINKGGYPNFELFFPKFSKIGVPFENEKATPSKVFIFNNSEHIIKKKIDNVSSFGDDSVDAPSVDDAGFQL